MERVKDFFVRLADYLEFGGWAFYKLIEKVVGYTLAVIAGAFVAVVFAALFLFSCLKDCSDQLESEWKSLRESTPTHAERMVKRIGLRK